MGRLTDLTDDKDPIAKRGRLSDVFKLKDSTKRGGRYGFGFKQRRVPTATIVPDGLVLYLNAGLNQSYPGFGSTWNDLSTYANNATIVEGTYFPDFDGYIQINDQPPLPDDYGVDFLAAALTDVCTVQFWARISSGFGIATAFSFYQYGFVFNNTWGPGFSTYNGPAYTSSQLLPANSPQLYTNAYPNQNGPWVNWACVMRSDVAYDVANKLYVGGTDYTQTLSQQFGPAQVGNFSAGVGRIGNAGYASAVPPIGTPYPMSFDCGAFMVYNRELSVDEIIRNIQATDYRFY
jgi:hypothetical protein